MRKRAGSFHQRRRRAFPVIVAGFVLALSIGVFANVAAADDTVNPSGDVSAATHVTPPSDPNPGLSGKCGLNVAMVIDRSGSTSGHDQDYKDAANAFIDGLVGTPSHIGVVTFSTDASLLSGYQDVSGGAGTLHTLINGLSSPSGFTNWQQALDLTTSSFASPDLVLFITDGNPTAHGNPGTDSGGIDQQLDPAILSANTLKASGAGPHITGVAVGNDIDISNIQAIVGAGSGVTGNDPDVTNPNDPSALPTVLHDLAVQLCGGTVTIHKTVQTGPDTYVDGVGWTFAAGEVSGQTDGSGLVNLDIPVGDLGTPTITETGPDGITSSIKSVDCGDAQVGNVTRNSFTVAVGQLDIVSCNVVNTTVDLSLLKTFVDGSASLDSGSLTYGYLLTATNGGPGDATVDATVQDVLPAGVSFVSFGTLPTGVDCDPPSGQVLTCTIASAQLTAGASVAIPVNVSSVESDVPTIGSVTNKGVVTSADDPAPCTVTDSDITCTEPTNNYSEVTTDLPAVLGALVERPPTAQVSPAQALAFTGSDHAGTFAGLGALLVALGAAALVLSKRRRGMTSPE